MDRRRFLSKTVIIFSGVTAIHKTASFSVLCQGLAIHPYNSVQFPPFLRIEFVAMYAMLTLRSRAATLLYDVLKFVNCTSLLYTVCRGPRFAGPACSLIPRAGISTSHPLLGP